MCITEVTLVNAAISSYLGLVPYGMHGIEMQHEGEKVAVFDDHKSVKRNWREAVQFAIEWHQMLFHDAAEAQAFATQRGGVVRYAPGNALGCRIG